MDKSEIVERNKDAMDCLPKRVLSSPKDKLRENDDEEEVKELEDQCTSSNQSLWLSKGMSEEQHKDHYQICLQMAIQNKINVKNAFSFRLIDMLKHNFLPKTTETINFTAAGIALVAGTKIYSYRVDNLYNQVVKLTNIMTIHSSQEPIHQRNLTAKGAANKTFAAKKCNIILSKKQLQRTLRRKKMLPFEQLRRGCLIYQFPLLRPSLGIVLGESRPYWPKINELDKCNSFVTIKVKSPEESSLPKALNEEEMLLIDCQSEYRYLDTKKLPLLETPEYWLYPKCFLDDDHSSSSGVVSAVSYQNKPSKTIIYQKPFDLRSFFKKRAHYRSCEFNEWKESNLLLVDEKVWQKTFKRLFCCNLGFKQVKQPPTNIACNVEKENCLLPPLLSNHDSYNKVSKKPKPLDKTIVCYDEESDSLLLTPSVQISNTEISGKEQLESPCNGISAVGEVYDETTPALTNYQKETEDHSETCDGVLESCGQDSEPPSSDVTCTENLLQGDNLVPVPQKKAEEPPRFSEILKSVRADLATNNMPKLSWQLGFVCLLHLATKRCLHLYQTDPTDVFIEEI